MILIAIGVVSIEPARIPDSHDKESENLFDQVAKFQLSRQEYRTLTFQLPPADEQDEEVSIEPARIPDSHSE